MCSENNSNDLSNIERTYRIAYGRFFPATTFFLLPRLFFGFLDLCVRVLEVHVSSWPPGYFYLRSWVTQIFNEKKNSDILGAHTSIKAINWANCYGFLIRTKISNSIGNVGSELDTAQPHFCHAQSQLQLCWTEISFIIDFTKHSYTWTIASPISAPDGRD